ncbi:hypothetical protein Scani_56980 [Streptomyces caniferus]|uniref:Uncharacterized protein n=1 Tax=Streptomyces caniferus TaxID=285557 RepID=A0A640SE85_9ACTN|nr:hypothetical protein Scani_56980 [Streptomyces caniferus]
MQLVGDQLIGEAAGEGHQVVGGDGAGDCDTHDGSAPAEGVGAGGRVATLPAGVARHSVIPDTWNG